MNLIISLNSKDMAATRCACWFWCCCCCCLPMTAEKAIYEMGVE